MCKALLLKRVISAAKVLFGPATFLAPSYSWPLQFPISRPRESIFFNKTDARFFSVGPFSQRTKDIKSSRISKLESTYRKPSNICSLFEQSRASQAIILYKPLFLTSSIILSDIASPACLIKSFWDSLEIYVAFLALFSRYFLRCISPPLTRNWRISTKFPALSLVCPPGFGCYFESSLWPRNDSPWHPNTITASTIGVIAASLMR